MAAVDSLAPVASPCTKVCRIDPRSGWCEGCVRSLDEIAAWSGLDDAGRREVLARLPARREALLRQQQQGQQQA